MTDFKSRENEPREKKMRNAQEKKKITAISLFNELTGDGLTKDAVFDIPTHPSTIEMWDLIEKTGIKREQVSKTFSTASSVAELYRMVYKRIHYEREQEMIRRLKVYVDKL